MPSLGRGAHVALRSTILLVLPVVRESHEHDFGPAPAETSVLEECGLRGVYSRRLKRKGVYWSSFCSCAGALNAASAHLGPDLHGQAGSCL